jgi:hypothetical protein
MNKKTFLIAAMIAATMGVNAQVTIGADIAPVKGALLEMKTQTPDADNVTSDKGGFMMPRVKLVDTNKLLPFVPDADATADVKKQHTGLQVYNLTVGNGFEEGFYYWTGAMWKKLLDQLPPIPTAGTISARDIVEQDTTLVGTANGSGGIFMDFGEIVIPESGAYAFSFRLYGFFDCDGICNEQNNCYYISLWNGTTLSDIAELNFLSHNYGLSGYSSTSVHQYTAAVTLGGYFSAGDRPKFKMSHHHLAIPFALRRLGTKAARTSLIWWKL